MAHDRKSPSSIRLVAVDGQVRDTVATGRRHKVRRRHRSFRMHEDLADEIGTRLRTPADDPADLGVRPADGRGELSGREPAILDPLSQLHEPEYASDAIASQAKSCGHEVELHDARRDHAPMARSRTSHALPPVGLAIRSRREQKEWTQEDLADAAGVSTSTVSRIETGDANYSKKSITKIANALGCAPGELIDGVNTDAVRQELHAAIDTMPDAEARRLLAILRAMNEAA